MMTRARFRAYGVHRVLDELLEVLGIRRVKELADNRDDVPFNAIFVRLLFFKLEKSSLRRVSEI